MKFEKLLEIVGRDPIFSSSMLAPESVDPADLGRQLSRWVKSGKLIQLRRGFYTLSEQYRKMPVHPFAAANILKRASYVSLQSALEHYDLIPEYVPSVTSVTTGRPGTYSTPIGNFIYRHIKKVLFAGYSLVDVGSKQEAFVARPEKALLDILYLTPHSDTPSYLDELRLQNTDILDVELLSDLAGVSGSRKLIRAVARVRALIENGAGS
jgi:predicted transcriptional regulator of viral defense system